MFLAYSPNSLEYEVLLLKSRKVCTVSSTRFFEASSDVIVPCRPPRQSRGCSAAPSAFKQKKKQQYYDVVIHRSEVGAHNLLHDPGEVGTHNVLPPHRRRSRAPPVKFKKTKPQVSPPRNFDAIEQHQHARKWEAAYDKEVNSMYSLTGMEIVKRSTNLKIKVLDILELFTWKFDDLTGEIQAKVRFVVRGDQEKTTYQKDALYSPVGEIATIKVLLNEAVQKSWMIQQADVSTAFLNSKVENTIYLKLPRGIAHQLNNEGFNARQYV